MSISLTLQKGGKIPCGENVSVSKTKGWVIVIRVYNTMILFFPQRPAFLCVGLRPVTPESPEVFVKKTIFWTIFAQWNQIIWAGTEFLIGTSRGFTKCGSLKTAGWDLGDAWATVSFISWWELQPPQVCTFFEMAFYTVYTHIFTDSTKLPLYARLGLVCMSRWNPSRWNCLSANSSVHQSHGLGLHSTAGVLTEILLPSSPSS